MSSAPETAIDPEEDRVAAAVLAAVAACPAGKTLCPGEVARTLADQHGATGDAWRAWLKPVRRTAVALAEAGRIGTYRKGRRVPEPAAAKGVIRLGNAAATE